MLNPVSAIKGIYSVASSIYDHVQRVKANKAQCQRLNERIGIIVEAVRHLEQLKNQEQYVVGLNALHDCLMECLAFIQQFSESNKWYKCVLKTGTYQKRFAELNDQLQKAVGQLNLGLSAQQLINHEQDKADQARDHQFICEQQEEIIQLNQEANQGIQKLNLQQVEQHEILLQQLASMRAQFAVFNERQSAASPLKSRYHIPYFELAFDSKLTEGSFGRIYLGRWCEQDVVIKTLEGAITPAEEQQFNREVQIMSRLRHTNITQFYGACLESTRLCLVMEHMEQGSLYDLLRKRPLTPAQQQQMALDIAKGLYYLHNQGVLHRDLKSKNVLVDAHGKAKLTDFGLSKTQAMSVKTTWDRSEAIAWQAPECLQRGATYTQASDVYSYGIILWELVTGKLPYADVPPEKLVGHILKGQREDIPATVPEVFANLIRACWEMDPAKRPDLITLIRQLEAYKIEVKESAAAETVYEQGIAHERQKDYAKAYQAYQAAAEQGYARAKTNLGSFYLKGIPGVVERDKAKASQYFLQAAQQGHVRAMVNLATMLKHGDGIPSDMKQAMYWYQQAGKAGDSKAQQSYEKLRAIFETATDSYRDFTDSQSPPRSPAAAPHQEKPREKAPPAAIAANLPFYAPNPNYALPPTPPMRQKVLESSSGRQYIQRDPYTRVDLAPGAAPAQPAGPAAKQPPLPPLPEGNRASPPARRGALP